MEQVGLPHSLDHEGADRVGHAGLELAGPRVRLRIGPQCLIRGAAQLAQRAHSSANASRAASTVRSTWASSCASEGNQASNWDGGGYTPRSSMARQKAAWASRSQAFAPSRSCTGSAEKNTVRSPVVD